jgi:hypothetical protein
LSTVRTNMAIANDFTGPGLLQPVRSAGGWWLVLVCSERKVPLAGWFWEKSTVGRWLISQTNMELVKNCRNQNDRHTPTSAAQGKVHECIYTIVWNSHLPAGVPICVYRNHINHHLHANCTHYYIPMCTVRTHRNRHHTTSIRNSASDGIGPNENWERSTNSECRSQLDEVLQITFQYQKSNVLT